ncbi:MAG: RagB/SusD family nutrient uptake outer membrane protein, partial [Muribaculaceae bacterium]|nr:RagB/SusD family nutrient uptake outer membrane protein [Muribaculaceae bacterium]
KFWSDAENLGDAQHPFLRAAELLLNEAEAAIENGDEQTARDCLVELNSNRMDEYTCTLSGDALKEEVRLYRRIELWGEGDTWFSFKRWNITAVRESWKAGDPTSNNFLPYYEGTYAPDYSNGWRYEIPKSEKDYNTIINNQLNN